MSNVMVDSCFKNVKDSTKEQIVSSLLEFPSGLNNEDRMVLISLRSQVGDPDALASLKLIADTAISEGIPLTGNVIIDWIYNFLLYGIPHERKNVDSIERMISAINSAEGREGTMSASIMPVKGGMK